MVSGVYGHETRYWSGFPMVCVGNAVLARVSEGSNSCAACRRDRSKPLRAPYV